MSQHDEMCSVGCRCGRCQAEELHREQQRLASMANGLIALRNKIDLTRTNIPAQTVPVDMTVDDMGWLNMAIAQLLAPETPRKDQP